MSNSHVPVLYEEVMQYLQPDNDKRYLDCTLGAAGHTLGLLKQGASVVGIDRDKTVLSLATQAITAEGYSSNFTPVHGSFSQILADRQVQGDFDGALFDLGVSSVQLDTPERGFSFRFDAPLDMRMDPDNQQVTAKDLVNGLGRKELYELFTVLGEERFARRLADAICGARRLRPIETTRELAELIEGVVPREGRLHPATKVFQALRMAVNTEREELESALPLAFGMLKLEGVLAVISFHSGEDRLVKHAFDQFEKIGQAEPLTHKPVMPTDSELVHNPRSRSAKLRVIKKKGQT